ncbi:MAG: NAD(P)H-hydrate dehydratase [Bacteroidales bacterium]|nr:NAD(P)H-hydrate dehydratase [Bacteroidales bacterium]
MKILTPHQIRAVDACTVEREPVSPVDLMERAATACVYWIGSHFDTQRKIAVFAGPGNNGGDGLAIARILQRMRYDVSVYMLTGSARLSHDALTNFQRLTVCKPVLLNGKKLPALLPSVIVIDALFGTGLSRPLDGLAAQTVAHINRSGCTVVSVDMPSGLFCDDNGDNDPDRIIRARYTLTFQQPKLSFFFAENGAFTGEWETLDIGLLPEAIEKQDSRYDTVGKQDIGYVRPRGKFAHKGDFGHACLIAGSHGMMGACVLAAKACMRTGCGLVTAHIPQREGNIMQIAVPEALTSFDPDPESFTRIPDLAAYSALGVGPGIGKKQETQRALLALLNAVNTRRPVPLVVDADALNILSENPDWLKLLPPNSVLTPHPGEFDRLAGSSASGYRRHLKQIEMAHRYSIFIVLKGAHTSIAAPDGRCFFNTSGNPGMATAGSGDVLTGIIVSLLAQGWPPCRAVCAGVWLHGAAGDKAALKSGQQSLIASDIIKNIGKAFQELEIEC